MEEGEGLVIRALGGLTMEDRGRLVSGLRSRTAEGLVVFLASTGRAVPREVLAELCWPGRPRKQALSNLRTALSILRSEVAPYLDVTRQTVALDGARVWLDAVALEARLVDALARWDRTTPLSPALSAEVEDALALYHGEFLEGFYLDSPDFEEWARMERDQLRLLVSEAIDALIDSLAARAELSTATSWSRRLVRLDPLREPSHRRLMRMLARSGRRAEALSQFERCRRLLARELGTRPSRETCALRDAIDGAAIDVDPDRAPIRSMDRAPHNLPAPGTTFVGRTTEIHELLLRLRDPECRLLTVLGPGGVGKTRLAIAVAAQCLERFPDGVFLVDLTSSAEVATLSNDLAAAIGIQFDDPTTPARAQLVGHLRDRAMLLVLDSFEHLPDAASLVGGILAGAPGVEVMVTSREVTGLEWEWLYPIEGLPFPPHDDPLDTASFEAVQLFIERARRAHPAFRPAEDWACVNRLCRLVEGMPLGIELAAAWLRTMACRDIASEILQLESPVGGRPPRHRSLRALFEHTWQHLAVRERDALMASSVFRGGFRRDAADAVARISPPALAALINKSLLRLDHLTGRYHLHELLRTHAAQKLSEEPEVQDETRARHARFYADFLGDQPLGAGGVPAALDAELDNIRAAFEWATAAPDPPTLGRALPGLSQLYRIRGWHPEAIAVFERALASVDRLPRAPRRAELQLDLLMALTSPLLTSEGYMSPRLGEVLARAWDICEGSEHGAVPALVLHYLATHHAGRADYAHSLQIAERLMDLGSREGDAGLVHAAHHSIGFARFMQGQLGPAMVHLDRVVAWYDPSRHRALDLVYGMSLGVFSQSWAAMAEWMLGHPDRALERSGAAIATARTLGHPLSLTLALLCAGSFVHDFRGEPTRGLACAHEALHVATEQALGYHVLSARIHHLSHLVPLGRIEEALEIVRSTAPAAESMTNMFLPRILVGYARVLTGADQHREAMERLDRALGVVAETGEGLTLSEVLHTRGEVCRRMGDDADAERDFQRALEIAREQGARGWELRAATSLARSWHAQGRSAEAVALLEPVYGWFTEGFDTRDLREARAFLELLSAGDPSAPGDRS